jgi:hypothetical protein
VRGIPRCFLLFGGPTVRLIAFAAAAAGISPVALGAAPDPLAEAGAALTSGRSEKIRAHAALVLGKRRDPRATPFLIRALRDSSSAVRAVAARALAELRDESARPALESAKNDRDAFVRRCVGEALLTLTNAAADAAIDVKAMGDKTSRASPQLRVQMRQFATVELRGFGFRAPGGFTLDGAIKELGTSTRADLVEVKVGVELVLSTGHPSAIVMMATGEAAVQKPKRQYRPAMQRGMEEEALEHAVRGASEELRDHFAANTHL